MIRTRRGVSRANRGVLALSVGLGIALVALVAFPFVATSYAERSIAPIEDSVRTTTSRGSSAATSTTNGDLPVRKLPLLSDGAFAAWQYDRGGTIAEVSDRVFSDSGAVYHQIADFEMMQGEARAERARRGDVDLGPAAKVAEAALADGASEKDVLALSAYLLLDASDASIDSNVPNDVALSSETLPLALTRAAAAHYETCDSQLAYAHAMSLIRFPSPDLVDPLFDRAIQACPSELTPRVAKAYYDLGFASEGQGGGCEAIATRIHAGSWTPVIAQFKAIQALAPTDPTGFVGEGDAYRVAGDVLSQWGAQPFTARTFRHSAIAAYEQALRLAEDPETSLSLARAQLAVGEVQTASELLARLPDDLARTPEVLHLRMQAAAAGHRYSDAEALGQQWSDIVLDSSAQPPVRQLMTISAGFVPNELTGRRDAESANLLRLSSCGGASLAIDNSFLPTTRPSDWPESGTPQLDYGILAKDWNVADGLCEDAYPPEDLPCQILLARGDASALDNPASDYYQNLLRSAGDLEGAATVARTWVHTWPDSATARERLGEIYAIQEDWQESAAASAKAVQLYDADPSLTGAFRHTTGWTWTNLREAVAEHKLGHDREALSILSSLGPLAESLAWGDEGYDPSLPMHVEQQVGLIYYDRDQYRAAIEHLERSIELGTDAEKNAYEGRSRVLRGTQAQTASAAALRLGDFQAAESFAIQAFDIDPANPLFRETLAEAERNTDRPAAIASYRSALEADPTLFSTWNNLGVLLEQQGQHEEALSAFEQAIALRPHYACAWFNVGVMESDRAGIAHFVRSQGAFGRAADLDATYRDQDRIVQFDEEIYDSGLDLSRPIPKDWTLTQTSHSRVHYVGIGLIILALLRVAWALGSDWLVGRGVERAITREAGRYPLLRQMVDARPSPLWTTLVTLGSLVLLSGFAGLGELIFVVGIGLALLGAHSLAPRVLSGQVTIRQTSFLPASMLTVGLAAVGLGFAPPAPIANTDHEVSVTARRSGIALLCLLTLVFGLAARKSAVPVARASATSALLLASSALVPVPPLDGARLGLQRSVELAVAVTAAAVTALLASGWI